jgi:hypothetical protein
VGFDETSGEVGVDMIEDEGDWWVWDIS